MEGLVIGFSFLLFCTEGCKLESLRLDPTRICCFFVLWDLCLLRVLGVVVCWDLASLCAGGCSGKVVYRSPKGLFVPDNVGGVRLGELVLGCFRWYSSSSCFGVHRCLVAFSPFFLCVCWLPVVGCLAFTPGPFGRFRALLCSVTYGNIVVDATICSGQSVEACLFVLYLPMVI